MPWLGIPSRTLRTPRQSRLGRLGCDSSSPRKRPSTSRPRICRTGLSFALLAAFPMATHTRCGVASSPTFYPGLRKKRNLPQRTPTLTEFRSACCGSPPPRPPFQELGPGSSIPSLAELEEARRFRDKLWKAKQTDQVLQAAKLKPCPELVQKRLGGCLGWRRDECV